MSEAARDGEESKIIWEVSKMLPRTDFASHDMTTDTSLILNNSNNFFKKKKKT